MDGTVRHVTASSTQLRAREQSPEKARHWPKVTQLRRNKVVLAFKLTHVIPE